MLFPPVLLLVLNVTLHKPMNELPLILVNGPAPPFLLNGFVSLQNLIKWLFINIVFIDNILFSHRYVIFLERLNQIVLPTFLRQRFLYLSIRILVLFIHILSQISIIHKLFIH